MPEPAPSRRRFVAAGGSIALAAVAGCTDSGDEPPEEAEESDEETGDNGETGADDEEEPAEDADEETYDLTVIVETEGGEPAVGAFVTVESEDGGIAGDSAEQPVDEEGQAVFTVANGDYTVEVDADEAEVGSGEVEEPVTIAGADEEVTVTVGEGDAAAGDGAEGDAGDEDGV